MPVFTIEDIFFRVLKGSLPDTYTFDTSIAIEPFYLTQIMSAIPAHQFLYFLNTIMSTSASIEINGKCEILSNSSIIRWYLAAESNFSRHYLKKALFKQFIREQVFSSAEALNLFTTLSRQQITDYLFIAPDYFEALIPFLNSPSTYSTFDDDKNMLLYEYAQKQNLTHKIPLITMDYEACHFGHTLSLKGQYDYKASNNAITFSMTGWYTFYSMKTIINQIREYQQKHPFCALGNIRAAFEFTLPLLNTNKLRYQRDSDLRLYKQYCQNEWVVVPLFWNEHTVSLVLYGDYLVFCNRGDEKQDNYAMALFKLHGTITQDVITSLLVAKRPAKYYHELLQQLVSLKTPLWRFKTKSQKVGNCTYSNLKPLILAMLTLQQVSPFASRQETILACKNPEPLRRYKQLTHEIKANEINLLIQKMHTASSEMTGFYADLCLKIVLQHPGNGEHPIKQDKEQMRARNLICNTPPAMHAQLMQDSDFKDQYAHLLCNSAQPTYTPQREIITKKEKANKNFSGNSRSDASAQLPLRPRLCN